MGPGSDNGQSASHRDYVSALVFSHADSTDKELRSDSVSNVRKHFLSCNINSRLEDNGSALSVGDHTSVLTKLEKF